MALARKEQNRVKKERVHRSCTNTAAQRRVGSVSVLDQDSSVPTVKRLCFGDRLLLLWVFDPRESPTSTVSRRFRRRLLGRRTLGAQGSDGTQLADFTRSAAAMAAFSTTGPLPDVLASAPALAPGPAPPAPPAAPAVFPGVRLFPFARACGAEPAADWCGEALVGVCEGGGIWGFTPANTDTKELDGEGVPALGMGTGARGTVDSNGLVGFDDPCAANGFVGLF